MQIRLAITGSVHVGALKITEHGVDAIVEYFGERLRGHVKRITRSDGCVAYATYFSKRGHLWPQVAPPRFIVGTSTGRIHFERQQESVIARYEISVIRPLIFCGAMWVFSPLAVASLTFVLNARAESLSGFLSFASNAYDSLFPIQTLPFLLLFGVWYFATFFGFPARLEKELKAAIAKVDSAE